MLASVFGEPALPGLHGRMPCAAPANCYRQAETVTTAVPGMFMDEPGSAEARGAFGFFDLLGYGLP